MRNFFIKLTAIYFFLIFIFINSLTFVSLIPEKFLRANIYQSIKEFKKQGLYPTFGLPFRKIIIDNFTNALMFNVAYSIDEKKPFSSAMMGVFYDNTINKNDQILNLEMTYQKKDIKPVNYYRYWHGYLLYLRPLLVFFSFNQIRLILGFILYLLFVIFITFCWNKLGNKISLAFMFGFLTVDFFFLAFSPNFFGPFFVGLFLGVIYLSQKEKIKNFLFLFFIAGGLTSFFDLLTAPLVSLGILLLCFLTTSKKNSFKQVFFACLFWALGYIFIWLTKWILVEFLNFPEAIKAGLSQVLYRSLAIPDNDFSYLKTLKLNLFQLIGYDKSNKFFFF